MQVDADGVALGAFQPGSSIDLVALLGGGVSSVRLEFDPTSEGYPSLPLRVGMGSFETTEDPLARQPGRVLAQAAPEPASAALVMSGLAWLAGARRRTRSPRVFARAAGLSGSESRTGHLVCGSLTPTGESTKRSRSQAKALRAGR
ncbi:MAG: PEP-CTERM sorting domain-containing protein [Candidatus Eisenbacteria bacterium]|uniref:PEP-CTERM sorting domain-containing protein n=1 Tax=Eiseniibacteriota bacterium TaxID=2212470 RepID=A0A538U5X1_UNCEI|nr:MAG: PEP-CTERM sorting domain-containing protein [Candidatus Eisenbacteria bacterium]